MSDVLRIKITLQPAQEAGAGWQVTMDAGAPRAGWPITRKLRKAEIAEDGIAFPLPPADDLAAAGEPHASLCGDLPPEQLARNLAEVHGNIINRQIQQGNIEAFGRYLFQTLIGCNWDAILAAARETKPRVLELALAWPPNLNALHRLNWEMLHGPNGFLAVGIDLGGGARCDVAITRVVLGASQTVDEVPCSPRMLFLIGTAFNDPEIRPGAEYLGLLRQLRESKSNRTLNTRVLQNASPKRIQAVVEDFSPHAVHFICHGNFNQFQGRGYLQLQVDPDDPAGSPNRFGDQIIEYLRGKSGTRQLPSLVVLSACDTGTVTGPDPAAPGGAPISRKVTDSLGPTQVAPLATELVSRGVPVVMSMAGRVSDLACRLFTRRFGQALLDGQPLTLAASQARRYAASHGASLTESPDWSFPSLFIAEGVPAGLRLSCTPDTVTAADADVLAERYQLNTVKEPVFCDRDPVMEGYFELFTTRPVLIAWQRDHGMGVWRLVRELANQALRDGHLPLVIGRPNPLDWKLNKIDGILNTLIAELGELAETVLALEDAPPLQLRALKSGNTAQLAQAVANLLQDEGGITPKVIARALALDLEALNTVARATLGPKGRPLVLFNDLERYDGEFLRQIDVFLRPGGLKPDKTQPIPVVAAFTLEGPAQEYLRLLTESKNSHFSLVKLEAFSPDQDEDLLVLQRILMHTYTDEDDLAKKPYVIAQDVTKDVKEKYVALFRRKKGNPKKIIEDLWDFVFVARDGFLKEADDEAILAQMQAE